MDRYNWRPSQAQMQVPGQAMSSESVVPPGMEAGDWRNQLLPGSRQKSVNKIMKILKRRLPLSGQEGLQELKKTAARFEEMSYTAATSRSDYFTKIEKMLTIETKSQNTMANPLQPNTASNSKNPQDPATKTMQSQIQNQVQSLPMPMFSNQSQARQQLLSQNNLISTGSQLPGGDMSQGTVHNVSGQNPNMQNVHVSNVTPNVVGNSMGQSMPSNMFANPQRQMGRQQEVAPPEQQQQSQNSQQYPYNQQLRHHLMKQKSQQGTVPQSFMQAQIQQQQQTLLQPRQLQSSQQAVTQLSVRQSSASPTLQKKQPLSLQKSTQSMLQQQSQSVLRQQQPPVMHQQQTSLPQHSVLPAQQHQPQQLSGQVKSMSQKALSASVSDISSVVSLVDRVAGSAPGNGSQAAVGEDLVAMTKYRLLARNIFTQDGSSGTKRMRRYTSAMPSNVVSSSCSVSDNFRHINGSESDVESTGASSVKRAKIKANHTLEEELHEINQRLIDTAVYISEDDVDPTAVAAAAEGGGTIVKCSFIAVALSPNPKSQYASVQMSPFQPLRLLIPNDYPNCSPILLDKFPVEVSKEYEDLSRKAKSRFSISLRDLAQPMSLGEIARAWDICARAVISEYAQQSGGGTFRSKYGTWEDCLSAA